MIERSSASSGVPASLADGSRSGGPSPNTSPEAISRPLRFNLVASRSSVLVQAAPPRPRASSLRRARAIRRHCLRSCSLAKMRRVAGGAALSLLRWPRISGSRRGSSPSAARESAYGGHAPANRPGSEDPTGEVELAGRRGTFVAGMFTSVWGLGERRIRRSARPAPRAAACPRRPAQGTPCAAACPSDESRVGGQALLLEGCLVHSEHRRKSPV